MSATFSRAGISPFVGGSIVLHAASVPAAVVAPSRWPWIAGALVADHCVLLAGGLAPRSRILGPNLTRSESARAAGEIVLTFDDGPEPATTPKILDRLEAHDAKATFFCVGDRVDRYRELAAEISRRGHRLENHTQTHPAMFFFHRPSRLEAEVARCQESIGRACGRAPRFFRAPAGIRSPLLQEVLARSGLRLTSWTRRGFDTVASDPARVARRLTRGMAAGDVLVLHDGGGAAPSGRDRVVLEALDRVLDAAAAAGLRPAALSDDEADRARD